MERGYFCNNSHGMNSYSSLIPSELTIRSSYPSFSALSLSLSHPCYALFPPLFSISSPHLHRRSRWGKIGAIIPTSVILGCPFCLRLLMRDIIRWFQTQSDHRSYYCSHSHDLPLFFVYTTVAFDHKNGYHENIRRSRCLQPE